MIDIPEQLPALVSMDLLQDEVKVLWTSPEEGAGCIQLKVKQVIQFTNKQVKKANKYDYNRDGKTKRTDGGMGRGKRSSTGRLQIYDSLSVFNIY